MHNIFIAHLILLLWHSYKGLIAVGIRLEHILGSAVVIAGLSLSGCLTPYHNYSTGSTRSVSDTHGADASVVNVRVIADTAPLTVDKLLDNVNIYAEYIAFKQKYQERSNQIISNLDSGNYSDANRMIRDIAAILKNDPNQYAQEYYGRISRFSYVRETTWEIKRLHRGAYYVLGIPLRQDVFGTQNYERTFTETEKYKVFPLQGREVKIE